MKHKTEDSIFRKKGFFVALYSSLGAVAVLALVITFSSLNGDNDPYGADVAPVGADDVLPYLEQARARADEEAWFRPRPTPTPPPMPSPVPSPVPSPQPTLPPPRNQPASDDSLPVPDIEPTGSPPPPEAYEPEPEPVPIAVVPATFTPFAENDKMVWPVLGEILMDFDAYAVVYDPTLDRFAINEDIRIAAQEGTPVRAGADGRVLAVGNNVHYGNYVTVDHGNGWVARYGQLMDAVMVNEGEIVRTGQVIGGVGQPSYFGTMLGTHFNFRVTRDGGVVNPNGVLAER
ncbi:MAG: M23 family metallopeptidase [Defluviitaleaceae bacterium]|nr:M23 family metallopeptidase [Defluviitaleaceae bacterium]